MSAQRARWLRVSALCAAFLALPGTGAWAAGVGTTGADFLLIPVGPRQVAMGDQGAALSDDGFSMYYNPAGIAMLQRQEIDLLYNQWVQGVSQQYLAYVYPDLAGGSLGASLNVLRVDPFQGYDNSGVQTSQVTAQDISPSLAYAHSVWGGRNPEDFGLAAGLSAQYIRENLESNVASGYAGNAGLLAHFPFKETYLQAGLAVQNVGSGLSYYGRRPALPETYSLGLSAMTKRWGTPLTLSVEGRKSLDLTPSFSVGAEYWLNSLFALRVGYETANDLGPGIRAGMGLRIRDVQFDYAMSIMGDFGLTHRVGLTYRFGAPSGIDRAKRLLEKKRYAEAVLEVNRVLERDPQNKPARELLGRLQQIMRDIEARPAS